MEPRQAPVDNPGPDHMHLYQCYPDKMKIRGGKGG